MNYNQLSEQVKQYSLTFFKTHQNGKLVYHDLAHTEGVLKAAIEISNHYQLNDEDFFIVFTAVWFHDIGYFEEDASDHEQKGAVQAEVYLQELEVDATTIGKIKACILATRIPQQPHNLLEEIVCDADMFHLGTEDFFERSKLVRREFELLHNTKLSKTEWRQGSIKLLQSHEYHTEYCRLLLSGKKAENLDRLLEKQNAPSEKKEDITENTTQPAIQSNGAGLPPVGTTEKKKKDKLSEKPERGIETMFRVASTNHQRLSDLSDNKAHIMISVNSVIISVMLLVLEKMGFYSKFLWPIGILLTGCVVAIIFSVLATRPKIPEGVFTKEQVDDKTVNLLFFGNFYNMAFSEYYAGMKKVMDDKEFLYGSLIRDIYSQGKVLGRKYKLLRISYTIFMFSIIIAFISFGIAAIFFV